MSKCNNLMTLIVVCYSYMLINMGYSLLVLSSRVMCCMWKTQLDRYIRGPCGGSAMVLPITQEITLQATHRCDRRWTRQSSRHRQQPLPLLRRKDGGGGERFSKQIHKVHRYYVHYNTKQRVILWRNFVWFYPEVSFITQRQLITQTY